VPGGRPVGTAKRGDTLASHLFVRGGSHLHGRATPFDATALVSHLAAHGVTPGEIRPRFGAEGTGPSLYLTDPEGNVVELKGPPA
jgi:hypothetical protein